LYISHIRGEGASLLDALDEFIEIVDMGGVRGEIYHLKAAGRENWPLMAEAIAFLEGARAEGLPITANMYPYPYSGTGLSSCIPAWAHAGGEEALRERLRDPATRSIIREEINGTFDTEGLDESPWENMYRENGPENILLCGFRQEALKPLQGKTLAQVAAERGADPVETLMDLLIEDESRIFCLYFSMSEDNLRKQMALPWVSICSDAESMAPEGAFLKSMPHPRAYGSFARVLAQYVRDEQIIPLEEAVRRMTSLPADNLRIERRGALEPGYYADVLVFDPAQVQDHATPENPHQYATGMNHVFVNGVQVLRGGEHSGALPGQVVRGPGYGRKPFESDYPAALHPLLRRGDLDKQYPEPNLPPPLPKIGKEYLPDLVRMVKDTRLSFFDIDERPEVYAPIHAAAEVARLGSDADLAHMATLFDTADTKLMIPISTLFLALGVRGIPVLTQVFRDRYRIPFARVAAMTCLRRLSDTDIDPIWVTVIENLFAEQLQAYEDDVPMVSILSARFLTERGKPEHEPLIHEVRKQFLRAGQRKLWEEVVEGVGESADDEGLIYEQDFSTDEDADYLPPSTSFFGPPRSQQKGVSKKKTEAAAKKKKAKRKAAKKRR
jgi:hypothetical protein